MNNSSGFYRLKSVRNLFFKYFHVGYGMESIILLLGFFSFYINDAETRMRGHSWDLWWMNGRAQSSKLIFKKGCNITCHRVARNIWLFKAFPLTTRFEEKPDMCFNYLRNKYFNLFRNSIMCSCHFCENLNYLLGLNGIFLRC